MWKTPLTVTAALLVSFAAGCTSSTDTANPPAAATQAETTRSAPAPNSKEALEVRARELDRLVDDGNAEAAYRFYSQRCKNIIGGLDTYKVLLEQSRQGRNPQFGGVTVKVNGSSAQVVTVDNDPNAPADSMQPRTWTFIDDTWQFDNC